MYYHSGHFTNEIGIQQGPMAKWIRRLTTDQEIPGSIPGRFDLSCPSFCILFVYFKSKCNVHLASKIL